MTNAYDFFPHGDSRHYWYVGKRRFSSFFPSDGVKVGDEYEGERTVEAFQQFINEKKSGKVEDLPKKEDQVETGKKKMTRK